MDLGASFHTTYCKEELEGFKLCSGKVHLADGKALDIADVEDVILKTSFGFEGQQWKVTKGRLVVAHGNKRGSLYMVEKAMAFHLLHQSKDLATMILLSITTAGVVVENDSIVAEHGLSPEITQILDGASSKREAPRLHRYENLPGVQGSSKQRIRIVEEGYNEEMVSLEKNQTYSLVRLPARKKASQSLWMFRVKEF
nr:hypothetical protein [Tanacetum cinerariifolium]